MSDRLAGSARGRHRAPEPPGSALASVGAAPRRALAAVAVTALMAVGGGAATVTDTPTGADTGSAAAGRSAVAGAASPLSGRIAEGGVAKDEVTDDRVRAARGVSRGAARPALSSPATPSPDQRGAEAGMWGVARFEAPSDPREIASAMLAGHGWSSSEFSCLDSLWISESDWDPYATNPTSGAYGIPQSLPPGKMATAGSDWRTNPATQIEWGLDYIAASYGSPCAAYSFKLGNGWY